MAARKRRVELEDFSLEELSVLARRIGSQIVKISLGDSPKDRITSNMIHSVSCQLSDIERQMRRINDFDRSDMEIETVRCHHGTTLYSALEVQKAINNGSLTPFRVSNNEWDWLGHGVYFWQSAPHRASERGEWWYRILRKQRPYLPDLTDLDSCPSPEGYESNFAVIEVDIHIPKNRVVDLLDSYWLEKLSRFHTTFENHIRGLIEPQKTLSHSNYRVVTKELPAKDGSGMKRVKVAEVCDDGPMCTRNCILINRFVESQRNKQCVRGSFREGDQVISGVNIHMQDHIQVNVLDQAIIDFNTFTIHDAANYPSSEDSNHD
jgi:uncharacterized ParB-like nuclease family protein